VEWGDPTLSFYLFMIKVEWGKGIPQEREEDRIREV
jgi:hypothetical protein